MPCMTPVPRTLAVNYTRKDTLDLGKINRFTGAYLPVVRDGRLYCPADRWRRVKMMNDK
mgnify:CR=1 FL=1